MGAFVDASCLQYALTEAERLEFAQRGYLVFDEDVPLRVFLRQHLGTEAAA